MCKTPTWLTLVVKRLIGFKMPSHSKPKRSVGLKRESCFKHLCPIQCLTKLLCKQLSNVPKQKNQILLALKTRLSCCETTKVQIIVGQHKMVQMDLACHANLCDNSTQKHVVIDRTCFLSHGRFPCDWNKSFLKHCGHSLAAFGQTKA